MKGEPGVLGSATDQEQGRDAHRGAELRRGVERAGGSGL
jgi:hypothetical protein